MPITRVDNAALFWNEVFLRAALADSLKDPQDPNPARLPEQGGPTRTSRAAAIVHLAIHNAINAIDPRNQLYQNPNTEEPAPPAAVPAGLFVEAAGAGAAHRALSELYPSQVATLFDDALNDFRGLPLPGANDQPSIDFGADDIAQPLLDSRAADGSQLADPAYAQPVAPGVWQPDPILAPPNPPLGVGWGRVEPFTLAFSSQLRPPAPPPLRSGDYAFGFRNVLNKGRNNSPAPPLGRTSDETEIARFWSYDDDLGTPIRLYNQHAYEILKQEPNVPVVGSVLHRHARMFALINVAMADAGIACWESKYFYNYWRPFQGIRGAASDGNPNTAPVANWLPLGRPRRPGNTTPNFPAYVSGHSSFGAATFGMLRKFFGGKMLNFTLTSEEVPGVMRFYCEMTDANGDTVTAWQQAINENSESRIFLGVHWRRDHTVGTPLGQQVADHIWPSFLRPTT